MTNKGHHIIADLKRVHDDLTKNPETGLMFMRNLARMGEMTILHEYVYQFGGEGGYTAVLVLAESHISIHTWPEYKSLCMDIFTCSSTNDLTRVQDYLLTNYNGIVYKKSRTLQHKS